MSRRPVSAEIQTIVRGRFGRYGGRYVPETLMGALEELERTYDVAAGDPVFQEELKDLLKNYVGRPTPLSEAPRLSERVGCRVLLKREDLNHTGAHKINNTIGQVLLARRMGKKRIIAETGAGQHGVATATACARFGLECVVYMGEEDMARQRLNVYRMRVMGATVVPVSSGTRTLKDALNEAMRDWVTNVTHTHYVIGTVAGPDPFPRMVRDFQSVIGREARAQVRERIGVLPATVVACVGGGSNAMGMFYPFLDDIPVELVGVEAAGEGLETGRHAATLSAGTPGVLHGSLSYVLQSKDGQVLPTHSVSAGLDYPGVGPEHSYLRDTGRVKYETVTDQEALDAFHSLARLEGILPALESSHAIAWVTREAARWGAGDVVLINLSGRGDKDVAHVAEITGAEVSGPLTDAEHAKEWTTDLAPVENLMQVMVKGLRAIQLYLPNNPIYQQAVQNIRNAFPPVWQGFDELPLALQETDFAVDGRPVLVQPAKTESVSWVLYKDGIRQLLLKPGVEEQEIVSFLGVINKVRNLPPDAEDDLLTLLWEQDFQFIRYNFVELGSEEAPQLQPSADGTQKLSVGGAEPLKATREVVEAEAKEAKEGEEGEEAGETKPQGLVSMEDFDPTLYFLDEKEIEYLKGEIDREYKQDLRGNVLSILFDLLELQTYGTVRAELISIVENFIPYLLAVGDFRSVAYVLREVKVVLQRAREMMPEHRHALDQLPARLSQPDALAQLLQSLDEAVVFPTEDELGELFRELRPEALESVLGWLPRLTNQRVRDLLDAAAQRLALAYPQEVTKALASSNETILLESIRLASRLKLPPAVPALGELLKHTKANVRVAGVEALSAVGSVGAMQQLERALDDTDRDVRLTAVRTMAQRGHRSAFPKVEAAVIGKQLRGADLTEKVAFFEAYGLLGGAEGVHKLAVMLESKGGFLKKKEDPETRACAAMALGKLGGEEARKSLQGAAQDKEPLVRNAVSKALREIK